MILKSFGCSYIFGSELADDGKNGPYANGSKLSWPALVAYHYNYQYYTYSRPGSGNQQILERLMSQIAGTTHHDTICIIGWSHVERFDYCSNLPLKPGDWPGAPWRTITPGDNTEMANIYYRDIQTDLQDKFRNLLYIKQAIDILKSKSIPFVMTYMSEQLFDIRWDTKWPDRCNTTPAITEMQEYIKPYMTTFDGLNFVEWSKENKFTFSKVGHPLEQAHQAASEYIIKLFDTQSIGAHCHLS